VGCTRLRLVAHGLNVFVFTNPDTDKPFYDVKRSFHTACRLAGIKNLWWQDLRATFCTRLALARYEALTIMSLMGHKDLKTTMHYIRAVQLHATCVHFSLSTNWPQMKYGRR
jgi:integrase